MIKKLTELGHKSKKTLIKMFKKENIIVDKSEKSDIITEITFVRLYSF